MKSPLKQRAEELQNQINDALNMLKKEGQSDGERRYKRALAEAVLLLLFRFDGVRTMVLIIFGMVLGHILSNVF